MADRFIHRFTFFFKVCTNSPPSPQVNSWDSDDQISDDGDGSGSGETVWPTIRRGNGSDFVSMAIPNVTSDEISYLLMMDDFGRKYRLPLFLLSPTCSSETVQNAMSAPALASTPNSNTAQSPFVTSPLPSGPSSPASSPAGSTPVAPPAVDPTSLPVSPINILATRPPPPVTAFVVPLPCVGAILLVAGCMSPHSSQSPIGPRTYT